MQQNHQMMSMLLPFHTAVGREVGGHHRAAVQSATAVMENPDSGWTVRLMLEKKHGLPAG